MHSSPHTALIIDGSAPVRTSLRGVLLGFGIHEIDMAASLAEARRRILMRKYDLILCEYHFDGEETGQDLLEQIIEQRMLPPPTIFIVVTTEASYPRVMSVAEITPDEYVLKPVQTGELADRIENAFVRRAALMDIHIAHHDGKYGQALKLAQGMLTGRSVHSSDVAKVVAQMLCKLKRYNEAAVFYRHIVATKNLAWARFGLAKMSLYQGDKETAEAMLLNVINQHLRYLPVYDYLVEFYLGEARFSEALSITEKALEISPHSIRRLQQAGQLAFDLGQLDKAQAYFDRVVALRGSTVELNFRSMLQLAVVSFQRGAFAKGASLVKQMQAKQGGLAGSTNAEFVSAKNCTALATVAEVVAAQPLAAIDRMRELAMKWDSPEFDHALARDYLAVLALLYNENNASVVVKWVEPIARRFMISEAMRDLLLAHIANCPRLAQLLSDTYSSLEACLQNAKALADAGDLVGAAQALIEEGDCSLNNRVLLEAAEAGVRSVQQTGDETMKEHVRACLNKILPPPDERIRERLLLALLPAN